MGRLSGHNRDAKPRSGLPSVRRLASQCFTEADIDPLRECIKLAKACKHAETRWERMFALIPYLYPKLQTVQVGEDKDNPIGGNLNERFAEAVKRARELLLDDATVVTLAGDDGGNDGVEIEIDRSV